MRTCNVDCDLVTPKYLRAEARIDLNRQKAVEDMLAASQWYAEAIKFLEAEEDDDSSD